MTIKDIKVCQLQINIDRGYIRVSAPEINFRNEWYQGIVEIGGKIGRSLRFDTQNKDGKLGMISIIIDTKKPIIIGEK